MFPRKHEFTSLKEKVISAADGHSTNYGMLNGRYISPEIDSAYRNWELFTPLVQVSFGIGRELPYETPILIHTATDLKIGMTNMEYGYSLMRYESPWKLWEHLEGEEYRKEKEQIEKDALACLEKIYPGITPDVEVSHPRHKPESGRCR